MTRGVDRTHHFELEVLLDLLVAHVGEARRRVIIGEKHLLGEYAELLCEVPVQDDGVLLDVDSPAALRALGGGD